MRKVWALAFVAVVALAEIFSPTGTVYPAPETAVTTPEPIALACSGQLCRAPCASYCRSIFCYAYCVDPSTCECGCICS